MGMYDLTFDILRRSCTDVVHIRRLSDAGTYASSSFLESSLLRGEQGAGLPWLSRRFTTCMFVSYISSALSLSLSLSLYLFDLDQDPPEFEHTYRQLSNQKYTNKTFALRFGFGKGWKNGP